ncbi:MAG: type II toxin-antitoxin system Phd/YefM family antitoxin [Dehalococcoidia bacterium]
MQRVGVAELSDRTTQIVRSVREDREEYLITIDGEAVAVLRPVDRQPEPRPRLSLEEELAIIDEVARLNAEGWIGPTAVEAVAEQRR